jgi:hypothetical protein
MNQWQPHVPSNIPSPERAIPWAAQPPCWFVRVQADGPVPAWSCWTLGRA